MNPDDPRAQRTRARLREAALTLAADADPGTLGVAAIARTAGVNRATVYAHYRDADELLTDAMEDALSQAARAAAVCPLDAPPDRAPAPIRDLFEHVAANAALYRKMLGPQGSPRFAARMRERMTEELTTRFTRGERPSGPTDTPADLHAAYLAGALTGLIAHWTANTPALPAGRAADTAWRLVVGASTVG
ncbi:TetR/AcrR family transcriptional regulator [Nocardiopsis potens]|uniref:TetR/AcrR family transcriptional regulator n=1 Tax=Nocardiopsis potens TaxID=1246458 RepID=UPI00034569DE|nr:TetR/AcrR family transcriptional regulator [Nocardiopsis potens]